MKNKQKLVLGVIAAIVLVGLVGVFSFSEPETSVSNDSNQTDQGIWGILSGDQGSSANQGSGSSNQESGSSQGPGSESKGSNPSSPGTKDCPTCGGSGYITTKVQKEESCPKTMTVPVIDPVTGKKIGDRVISCPLCDGTGIKIVTEEIKEKCPTCGGSGKVPA